MHIKRIVAAAAAVAGLGVVLVAPAASAAPAQAAQSSVLITAHRHDGLGDKRSMDTNAKLEGNIVSGVTIIENRRKLVGFHGCVRVAMVDAYGNYLAWTPQKRYGVQGTKIGNSRRVEDWADAVDPIHALRTASLEILHDRC